MGSVLGTRRRVKGEGQVAAIIGREIERATGPEGAGERGWWPLRARGRRAEMITCWLADGPEG